MHKQAPNITMIDTDSLIPYVNNARTHSQEQINQIAASIKEFGFINPVIIDGDNGIIAGHGRVQAAQKLGMAEVPCVQASHLTEAQKKAYILADNKLALNAGWDDELLRLELQSLDDLDFDLELTGFDLEEMAVIFDEEEEPDIKEQHYATVFNLLVNCDDENQQEALFNKLQGEGYKCQPQSL
jgi:hypothetical protein